MNPPAPGSFSMALSAWRRGILVGAQRGMAQPALVCVPAALIVLMLLCYAPLLSHAAGPIGGGAILRNFAVAEIAVFSLLQLDTALAVDLRRGAFERAMLAPAPLLPSLAAPIFGVALLRAAVLAPLSTATAFALVPDASFGILGSAVAALSLAAGLFLGSLVSTGIALTTILWGNERPTRFLVWKATFLFGGLLLPLRGYPDLLEAASWWTPFPAVFSAAAECAVWGLTARAAWALAHQTAWTLAALAACGWLVGHVEARVRAGRIR